MKSSSALAALVAVGTALALTACSSSGSTGSGSGSTGSGSGSGSGSGAGPTSAGSAPGSSAHVVAQSSAAASTTKTTAGKSFDVCTALPLATLAKITGVSLATAKSPVRGGVIAECEYAGGTNLLQVAVSFQYGQQELESDIDALKQVGHPPTKISGVGDEAYSEPDPKGNAGSAGASAFASYGARFGDTYIKVGGFPYVNAAQGKQIVEFLHSKM